MAENNVEPRPFQILAISGGGVRGLYAIKVLADLEQGLADKSGDPDYNIACHFDLVSGTSVGGLFALGLAYGKTARELLTLIDERRLRIFPQNRYLTKYWATRVIYKAVRTVKQAIWGLYSQEQLKALLDGIFGEAIIGDLKKRVLVPAVNYSTGAGTVFKTPHHPDFEKDWHRKITDVALATSAAPTYFPIHAIGPTWYVDGGLVANAPGLVGVHEAMHFLKVAQGEIRLMAVGTMGTQITAQQEKSRQKGYIGWSIGKGLLELTLSANETLHNQLAEHMLGKDNCLFIDEHQTAQQADALELDNASDGAADILKARGEDTARKVSKDEKLKNFFMHEAVTPDFYWGANKNCDLL